MLEVEEKLEKRRIFAKNSLVFALAPKALK